MEELDEWIIDDEVYSAAMDVAPIDNLEVLEQSLAEMTRHSHRERRHHRNNTQTAHRKTKRRKPRSIEVREDIGPVRTRYTRHHHNNNNNNTNDEETHLIDLADEAVEESSEPKYNLRKRRAPKELPDDFIELAYEDPEIEQKEQETASVVTVINDGCHMDRRSIVSTPTKIIKATEVHLPVDQFADKPGDHDHDEGLSEDEVVVGEDTCIEHNFIDDMDINYIQSKVNDEPRVNDGKNNREANGPAPQFTLTDIPFTDDDAEKVMPIEGATDLPILSVNNVSINNEVPTDPTPSLESTSAKEIAVDSTSALKPPSKPPFPSAKKTPILPKPLLDTETQKPVPKPMIPTKPARAKRRPSQPSPVEPTPVQKQPQPQPVEPAPTQPATTKPSVDSTTALKTPPKPQQPTPAVKKTAVAAAKFLVAPAIEKPPSNKTKIKELRPSSNAEPVSSAKAQILSKIKLTQQAPQSEGPASVEQNGEVKAAEGGDNSPANDAAPKRRTLAGRKGKEKRTALSAKITSSRTQQSQANTNNEKKTPAAKLIVNDSSQNVIQSNVIDAQKLNKVSFKKKTAVVEPTSQPVPPPSDQAPSDSSVTNDINNAASAPSLAGAPDTMTNTDAKVVDQSVTRVKEETVASTTNTSENLIDSAPSTVPSFETENNTAATGNEDNFISERLAPNLALNFDDYQQHGEYTITM